MLGNIIKTSLKIRTLFYIYLLVGPLNHFHHSVLSAYISIRSRRTRVRAWQRIIGGGGGGGSGARRLLSNELGRFGIPS